MRLILFRHGPAGEADAEKWPDDGLRPLTARGMRRTHEAARGLARLEPHVTLILSSPLERATQTAAILREVLAIAAEVSEQPRLAQGGGIRELLAALPETAGEEALVLVGHEPHLGKLAGTLLFGAPAHLPIKKAGACAIEFDGMPRAGAGRLAWFLPPRALRQLARRKRGPRA